MRDDDDDDASPTHCAHGGLGDDLMRGVVPSLPSLPKAVTGRTPGLSQHSSIRFRIPLRNIPPFAFLSSFCFFPRSSSSLWFLWHCTHILFPLFFPLCLAALLAAIGLAIGCGAWVGVRWDDERQGSFRIGGARPYWQKRLVERGVRHHRWHAREESQGDNRWRTHWPRRLR